MTALLSRTLRTPLAWLFVMALMLLALLTLERATSSVPAPAPATFSGELMKNQPPANGGSGSFNNPCSGHQADRPSSC